MKDLSNEELILRAQAMREMQTTAGWKYFVDIVTDIRMEAFREWSDLSDDARSEKAFMLRATNKAVGEILNKADEAISEGIEAQKNLETIKLNSRQMEVLRREDRERELELEKLRS